MMKDGVNKNLLRQNIDTNMGNAVDLPYEFNYRDIENLNKQTKVTSKKINILLNNNNVNQLKVTSEKINEINILLKNILSNKKTDTYKINLKSFKLPNNTESKINDFNNLSKVTAKNINDFNDLLDNILLFNKKNFTDKQTKVIVAETTKFINKDNFTDKNVIDLNNLIKDTATEINENKDETAQNITEVVTDETDYDSEDEDEDDEDDEDETDVKEDRISKLATKEKLSSISNSVNNSVTMLNELLPVFKSLLNSELYIQDKLSNELLKKLRIFIKSKITKSETIEKLKSGIVKNKSEIQQYSPNIAINTANILSFNIAINTANKLSFNIAYTDINILRNYILTYLFTFTHKDQVIPAILNAIESLLFLIKEYNNNIRIIKNEISVNNLLTDSSAKTGIIKVSSEVLNREKKITSYLMKNFIISEVIIWIFDIIIDISDVIMSNIHNNNFKNIFFNFKLLLFPLVDTLEKVNNSFNKPLLLDSLTNLNEYKLENNHINPEDLLLTADDINNKSSDLNKNTDDINNILENLENLVKSKPEDKKNLLVIKGIENLVQSKLEDKNESNPITNYVYELEHMIRNVNSIESLKAVSIKVIKDEILDTKKLIDNIDISSIKDDDISGSVNKLDNSVNKLEETEKSIGEVQTVEDLKLALSQIKSVNKEIKDTKHDINESLKTININRDDLSIQYILKETSPPQPPPPPLPPSPSPPPNKNIIMEELSQSNIFGKIILPLLLIIISIIIIYLLFVRA